MGAIRKYFIQPEISHGYACRLGATEFVLTLELLILHSHIGLVIANSFCITIIRSQFSDKSHKCV